MILPGFVNAHSHLEYAVYAGFGDGQPFGPWLATHIARKQRLDDAWRLFDEGGEQVEGLAREVHAMAVTADDAPPRVQRESAESHDGGTAHGGIISGMFVCPPMPSKFP